MGQPIPDFGKFLEGLRGSMSLREAARKSGLSHAYIRDLELERNRSTNEKITPSPDTLQKLSKAYGFSYTDLMVKAGHLKDNDIPEQSQTVSDPIDLSVIYYIEIGMNEITFYENNRVWVRKIDSLLDFSSFMDRLDEDNFKKLDADLFVNLNQIRKYDEKRGQLFFDEMGIGPKVRISAIRQKKFHEVLLRSVANNINKSLEFSLGKGQRSLKMRVFEENI